MNDTRIARRRVLGWMLAGGLSTVAGAAAPRVIEVGARRYVFTPDRIALQAGESVVIALTAQDVVMGFSVPDYGVRVDLPPGQTVKVPITAGAAGSHIFLCDIFCGGGHENMNGVIVVT